MDAPERIWTAPTKGNCHVGFNTPSMNYTNEYVRADLAAPLTVQAAAQVLLEAWQNSQTLDADELAQDEADCRELPDANCILEVWLRALAKPTEGDKP